MSGQLTKAAKQTQVATLVDAELLRQLDEKCDALGHKRAGGLRLAIKAWVDAPVDAPVAQLTMRTGS
ncbi:MAG TPA: hypothetical protein VFN92_08190 [Solirubrobacterales bacterium]|nr:hypothetical protein [Solirubrobacterales bacterium]